MDTQSWLLVAWTTSAKRAHTSWSMWRQPAMPKGCLLWDASRTKCRIRPLWLNWAEWTFPTRCSFWPFIKVYGFHSPYHQSNGSMQSFSVIWYAIISLWQISRWYKEHTGHRWSQVCRWKHLQTSCSSHGAGLVSSATGQQWQKQFTGWSHNVPEFCSNWIVEWARYESERPFENNNTYNLPQLRWIGRISTMMQFKYWEQTQNIKHCSVVPLV